MKARLPSRHRTSAMLAALEADGAEPSVLARAATLASGKAMEAGRWADAKALAGLAESYSRLGERSKRAELTVETMDLKLLFEAVNADPEILRDRFWINQGGDDPHRSLKENYWDQRRELITTARDTQTELMRRVWKAERLARERGATLDVSEAGRAAEDETARWAVVTDDDIAEACDGGRSASLGGETEESV